MNLWLLAQEVAHIKRKTLKSILGLNGLILTKIFVSHLKLFALSDSSCNTITN